MTKLAHLLAHLLNPLMLALVIFAVHGWRGDLVAAWVGIGIFSALPGAFLLLRLRRLGQLYPDDRRVRGVLLRQGAVCYGLGLGALYGLGATPGALAAGTVFVAHTLAIWWINRFWKISIHAAGVGGAICILLASVGQGAWPFVLCLPAIAWARLYLGAHTPWQVGAGAALGLGFSAAIYRAYGLI